MTAYETPVDACIGEYVRIMSDGHWAAPRGQFTHELTAQQIVIKQPWLVPFNLANRGLNSNIARLEILSLIGQTTADAQQRVVANGALGRYHDGPLQHGNYGERVRGQLGRVVNELKRDKDSRRAVLSVYNGRRDLTDSNDVPCTIGFQFLLRRDQLHMIATMRSSDVVMGLPYDLMQFGILHATVAQAVGVDQGDLTLQCGSAHVYESTADLMAGVHKGDAHKAPKKWWTEQLDVNVRLCQDVLIGAPLNGRTAFEKWLIALNRPAPTKENSMSTKRSWALVATTTGTEPYAHAVSVHSKLDVGATTLCGVHGRPVRIFDSTPSVRCNRCRKLGGVGQ